MSRKAQAAVEFLILLGFMLLVFTLFFVIISERAGQSEERAAVGELASIGGAIREEVLIASSVHDGYNRTFFLPLTVQRGPYTLKFLPNGPTDMPSELVISDNQTEYLVFLPANLTPGSTISVGYNQVFRRSGNISVSNYSAASAPECTSAADCNDGNACSDDTCINNVCAHYAASYGTACDTGTACELNLGTDMCVSGVCACTGACTALCTTGAKRCTTEAVPLLQTCAAGCWDASPTANCGANTYCDATASACITAVTVVPACSVATPTPPPNEDLKANVASGFTANSFAYDWRKSGTSFTALYMTFDDDSTVNSVVRDYSTTALNGVPRNGVAWVSAGRMAGAYSFDGTDDYIDVPNNARLNAPALTISVWVYPQEWDDGNVIDKGANAGYRWRINSNGKVQVFDRGATNTVASNAVLPLNAWSHVVVVLNTTGLAIYINGTKDKVKLTPYGNNITADRLHIGAVLPSPTFAVGEYFHGMIDDVRIYDRSLSPAQIYLLNATTGPNLLSNMETTPSDSWSVCITPVIGASTGAQMCSATVSVSSSPSIACTCTTPGDTSCANALSRQVCTMSYAWGSPIACNDNLYCDGTESCSSNACVSSGNPCSVGTCVEASDTCV